MTRRVLISGGGIAGLALAHHLRRSGVEPIIVERARRFEALGHYIALKGAGVDAIRLMGLEPACRARELRFNEAHMFTQAGRRLRMGSRAEFDRNLGGYILLRRADLQEVLYEAVRNDVEIRYGQELDSVNPDGFDYVVGADGIHSRVRRLAFGDGFLRPFGGQYVALTLDGAHGLAPNMVRSYFGVGRSVHLFVSSASQMSAVIYHGDVPGEPPLDRSNVKARLIDGYRAFAPEVRAVFAALDERAFVFVDTIAQVCMPSIVRGQVALVGDAAHCPTFMSGMGSALALQGARLLGQCIAAGAPLSEYEAAITPIAARYQASARAMRVLLLDRRWWLASARDLALRLTPEWIMRRRVQRFYQVEGATP